MKKHLLFYMASVCLLCATAVQAATTQQPTNGAKHARVSATDRQTPKHSWHKSEQQQAQFGQSFSGQHTQGLFNAQQQTGNTVSAKASAKSNQVATAESSTELPATNGFGTIVSPDGSVWTYTIDLTEKSKGSYSAAHVKIYDGQQQLLGEFTDTFTDEPGVTGVNSVQVNPLVTKKFFNLDDQYEVMLYVHATTEDYQGKEYNDVFSIGTGNKICSIEGNQVLAQNTARDAWSENYTLVFQRDSTVENISGDDYSYEYYLIYDVYQKASYSGFKATPAHTFVLDYAYISGAGNASVPIIMQQRNHQIYYAFARYEKEFFDPSTPWNEEPVVQPDNRFIITLLDSRFDTISQTYIPCPTEDKYIYTFPYIGGLRYNDDLAFDFFPQADTAFVVSYDHYTTTDEFLTSYYVFNTAGQCIDTIAEYTSDYLWMSDIRGEEEQYCFMLTEGDDTYFSFVDVPSCKEVLRLSSVFEGNQLSANLDRYPSKDGYRYVFSLSYGIDDAEGNTIHSIAWLNQDGSLNHYDKLNLGQGIQLANPYINAEALNPWLFNTDDLHEYMVLVKRLKSTGGSASEEHLYIVNTKGERPLDLGPDATKGNLSGISLLNPTTNPVLTILYYNSGAASYYTPTFTSLPLHAFAGGDGTKGNPYQIATAGDFKQISSTPSSAFRIINDLDFQSISYSGVSADFTGILDGQEHILTNLVLEDNGLFHNVLENATIENLTLYEPVITLEEATEAGLVANSVVTNQLLTTGVSTLQNIHIYSPKAVAGEDFGGYFGGIVGSVATGSKVIGCSVNDASFALTEDATAGGIAGSLRTGSHIGACAFGGSLTAGTAAGIAGENTSGDETISDCHSSGAISGYEAVAGIIGSSSRAVVNNCFAEGSLSAMGGMRYTAAGGIAGSIEETYEAASDTIIAHCLVSLDTIAIAQSAANPAAHRIAGYTSADKKEIDWDRMDSEWTEEDWNDYYEGNRDALYKTGAAETGLGDNYALAPAEPIDGTVLAADSTTEGATLAALTTDFLAAHSFAQGTTADAPWVYGTLPYLWYEAEAKGLIADKNSVDLLLGDSTDLCLTVLNGDASQISIAADNNHLIYKEISNTKDSKTVRLYGNSCGTTTLTALYGDLSAVCSVTTHRKYINMDAEQGAVEQAYTDADIIAVEDMRATQGFILFMAQKQDESDKTLLYLFCDEEDSHALPAGQYTIGSTYADHTVLASTGLAADGTLTPSYYTTITNGNPQQMYFLVAGSVEIAHEESNTSLTVDAVNSYNLPVHITYQGTLTAIDQTTTSEESGAHKVLEDGILYIIHDGGVYTATGMSVGEK